MLFRRGTTSHYGVEEVSGKVLGGGYRGTLTSLFATSSIIAIARRS